MEVTGTWVGLQKCSGNAGVMEQECVITAGEGPSGQGGLARGDAVEMGVAEGAMGSLKWCVCVWGGM